MKYRVGEKWSKCLEHPLGRSKAPSGRVSSASKMTNEATHTMDTSALAKNFCTAFFLLSLSTGPALVGLSLAVEIALACEIWNVRGGDAEVVDDVGVAMEED
jgi:hypothetical protein